MTKWTPELAQEVWKAEGRRKALRGNSKLWIWFSQDRKRRGGGDKEHSKQIRVSSTLPAGRLPAPPIPASTITDNELLPHSKDFDCPKQNPTQRAAEMNQTVKITLWFMSNHCLHTPLPKATQLQDAFHGCSSTSWEAFTNQKNRCPHHYPSIASDRACSQGVYHTNITIQQDINSSKCHQPSPCVWMCQNRHELAMKSLHSHTHHPWGASGQLGPRWAQASQTVKRKATQQQWNARSSQRKS